MKLLPATNKNHCHGLTPVKGEERSLVVPGSQCCDVARSDQGFLQLIYVL